MRVGVPLNKAEGELIYIYIYVLFHMKPSRPNFYDKRHGPILASTIIGLATGSQVSVTLVLTCGPCT